MKAKLWSAMLGILLTGCSEAASDGGTQAGALPTTQSPVPIRPQEPPAPLPPPTLMGSWMGIYTCRQGETGVELEFTRETPGGGEGVFRFFALATNPGVPAGSFAFTYQRTGDTIKLFGKEWLNRPETYYMLDAELTLSPDMAVIKGLISQDGCSYIEAKRR